MKVLVVIIALAALGSLRYLAAALGPARPAEDNESSKALILKGYETDDDRDGLALREEEYWRTNPKNPDTDADGFLDGEEVVSGHHPLIKGPDDWLDRGKNLTTRTLELALGGVLAGDLTSTDSATYEESVQALADAMAAQYRKNAAIELDTLSIIEPTLENREAYLKEASSVFLQTFLPAQGEVEAFLESISDIPLEDPLVLAQDSKRYAKFTAEARRLSTLMGERAKRLAEVPVPRTFAPSHRSGVRVLRHFQANLALAATLKEDVLQGTAAIRVLVQLYEEALPRFVYDFSVALQDKLNE